MKRSAGILVYKIEGSELLVFLTHFGGPYWAKKESGAWAIPKGGIDPDEDVLLAAIREFEEETGIEIRDPSSLQFLKSIKQKNSNKLDMIFCTTQEIDPSLSKSNLFSLEWPPKSGKIEEFPEMDRAAWFPIAEAKEMVYPGHLKFLEALEKKLFP